MTPEELIDKYAPENARNLTPEDIDAMKTLTTDEIGVLAAAYPNKPSGNTYLRLFDSRLDMNKQLYPLSSWQNLFNLRSKLHMDWFKAFTFTNLYQSQRPVPAATDVFKQPRRIAGKMEVPKAVPIDLTEHEIEGMPGATGSKQQPIIKTSIVAKGVTKKEMPEDKK